ncbi:MAG: hypothetical protein ACRDQI_00515 [Pseudonocardiaceae bacterium]
MTAAISEGYTLVTCVAPACGTEQPDRLAVVLRDCVLSSRDGVLVVSGCSLGAVSCRFRPAGPLVHVQPCDADRPGGPGWPDPQRTGHRSGAGVDTHGTA